MPEAIAGSSFCLGLKMFAERVAHGRHQLIGKACRLARAKVGIECRRIELGGTACCSFGRVNPAAAFRRARQGCRMLWRPITLSCMASCHLGRSYKACRDCGVEPGHNIAPRIDAHETS